MTPFWSTQSLSYKGHPYIFCSPIAWGPWTVPIIAETQLQAESWQQFNLEQNTAWALHLKVTKGPVKIFEYTQSFGILKFPSL